MKHFIGVIMLEAEPMTKGEAFDKGYYRGSIVNGESKLEGYVILFSNGNTTWMEKESFESAYFPISNKNHISEEDVEKFIVKGEVAKLGNKTTVVVDTTLTGFDTVGTSAIVSPFNYDENIGAKYAREKIKSKIWGHLGFVLQWALNGLKR